MLETRPDRLGEGLGKFKAEEQGAGGEGGGVIQASPVGTGAEFYPGDAGMAKKHTSERSLPGGEGAGVFIHQLQPLFA